MSEDFCVHLWFNPSKWDNNTDRLEDVVGQPKCLNNMHHTRYMWNESNPTTGLSFKIWKRVDLGLKCSINDTVCDDQCDSLGGILDK